MSKRKLVFSLIAMLICTTLGAAVSDIPDDMSKIPFLSYPAEAIGKQLRSPIEGLVVRVDESENLSAIVLICSISYYMHGETKVVQYEMVITHIADFTKADSIKIDQPIGVITEKTRLFARNKNPDPFMVRMTNQPPVLVDSEYYFSPAWLMQTASQTLTFRQVGSFEDAVKDFYGRWSNEDDHEENSYATIHYFPDLDRIRAKISLLDYPKPVKRTQALAMTEMNFYRANLFFFESEITIDSEYQPVLYWQRNFDAYLREEYTLGDEIYVYCSIYTLDHVNKKIVVCVRDFSYKSDEEIIQDRLKDIR